ncbi:MAG: GlsB/YeaQ/YmgE family stress response membrane protein [Ramlibacter sp.]|nr:GlsB/YeaQ/YmgE family stress response membrane protein [Ramlibacter sp.]
MGALVGWLAWTLAQGGGRILLIENILVGIFGAFVGGDFLVALMNKGVVDDKVFKMGSLVYAVMAAVLMLLILKLLRHAVGPMKAGKKKARARG